VHSETCSGDAVIAGTVCVKEVSRGEGAAGSGECVVHPETDIAAIQMMRSAITFGFI
jgi:hypothetical protein